MPKMKTHKAATKRLRVTGAKKGKRKVMRRYAAQDHFNAREKGKATRNKRRDLQIPKTEIESLRLLLPNAGL